MSALDDLWSDEEEPKKEDSLPGIEMGGSFACQTCNEIVSEARWQMDKRLLVYTCSNKHVSKAKL